MASGQYRQDLIQSTMERETESRLKYVTYWPEGRLRFGSIYLYVIYFQTYDKPHTNICFNIANSLTVNMGYLISNVND